MLRASLLALMLLGQFESGLEGPVYSTPATTAALGQLDAGSLLFSLLVNDTDQSSFEELCDTYSADITGANAWCLRGDGGVDGEAMTATGTTTEFRSVCGNGPNCEKFYRQRFAATDEVATGNVASPTDAFTVCVVFSGDTLPVGGTHLVTKLSSNVVSLALPNGSGGVNFTVFKSGGSTSLSSSNAILTARTRNIACGRYDYVTDGTSIQNVWLNGAQAAGSTSSTTAVGPPLVASNPWKVHGSASAATGTISNAFYVPSYLSDAKLLAMANSALGKLTPTLGGAVSQTRSTVRSCFNTAGDEVTFSRINQTCVTQASVASGGTIVNKLLHSEGFDQAGTWVPASDGVTALPTVTANSTDVLDPFGTNTAEKIVFPAVSGAGKYSYVGQSVTATAAGWSFAPMFRTASGEVTLYVGASIATPTYHSQACTITTTWAPCELRNKTLTAASWLFYIGTNLNDGNQADTAGGTIYAWGAEAEIGPFIQGYSLTTSTQVTRSADSLTGSNPLVGLVGVPWCTSANVTSPDSSTWVDASIANRTILSIGSYNTTNTQSILSNATAGVRNQVWDATTTLLTGATAAGTMTAGPHTVATSNAGFAMTTAIDGVNKTITYSSAGTGTIGTQPATLYIGTDSGSRALKGLMKSIKMGDSLVRCSQ